MCRILRVLEGSGRLNVLYLTFAGRLWEAKCLVFVECLDVWRSWDVGMFGNVCLFIFCLSLVFLWVFGSLV